MIIYALERQSRKTVVWKPFRVTQRTSVTRGRKRKTSDNLLIITRLLRAENGIRTRDPQLGKLMLYRLSYFRITEYKVTPFFLFVKFSAAEKCAYPTIFFSDARFSGFFRLRPSDV